MFFCTDAFKAIKWLTTHRNHRGGFVSTQDTIVALKAISEYSKQITKEDVALKVGATTGKEKEKGIYSVLKDGIYSNHIFYFAESGSDTWGETFDLDPTNQLLFTRESVPLGDKTTRVNLNINGNGCAMVQTLLR